MPNLQPSEPERRLHLPTAFARDCAFASENLEAHALHALDDDEATRVDRHVSTCPRCAEKLERFVDRELTPADLVEVQRHLEACPPCEDRYRFEEHLKRLVKVCCDEDSSAPPALRENLRQILF